MITRHSPRAGNPKSIFCRAAPVILALATLVLGSCGGGDAPPPVPVQGPSAGGIWRGTDSASGLAMTGLVDETGFGEFMRTDEAVFEGQVSTSTSSSISVDAQGYPQSAFGFPDGSIHGIWTVNGTIQERKSISATIHFTTDAGTTTQGTLDLTFDALYNQPSSLATVAGSYTASGTDFIEIASDGSISGHVVTLGDYSGQISLINPAYNLYRVQLTLRLSSGGVLFDASGLATMDNTVSPSRLLIVGVLFESGKPFSWVDTWCAGGGIPGC